MNVWSRRGFSSLLAASAMQGIAPAEGVLAGAGNPIPAPTSISGLSHWFDASTLGGFVDAANRSVVAGTSVAALKNKASGTGVLIFPPSSANGRQLPTGWQFRGRTVGELGGVGAFLSPEYGTFSPLMDCTTVPRIANVSVGNDSARTIFLVFSRVGPNEIPFGTAPAEVSLLTFDGTVILSITNTETPVLKLFPRSRIPVVVGSQLAKRSTLSITLRFSQNGKVDVWVNDKLEVSGALNMLPASKSGTLFVLGDGLSGNGGAGSFFHDLAIWGKAISSQEINTLLFSEQSVSKKWLRGPRVIPTVLLMGQSNASNFDLDGGTSILAEGARWNLGALGVNLRQRDTVPGGTALYNTSGNGFLIEQPGVSPSRWMPGSNGANIQKFIASLSVVDRFHFAGVFAYYSENDQGRNYNEKTTYKAAWQRLMSLIREWSGLSARSVALMQASIPYVGDAQSVGSQMIAEVMSEMTSNPEDNTTIVLPNTSAAWGRGASAAGTGGDPAHLDAPDNQHNARLAGAALAARIVLSGHGDLATPSDAASAFKGGPRPVSAVRDRDGSILVTIKHDAGSDIVPPARTGHAEAGWRVFNGYRNAGAIGVELPISAVERVDAKTLRIVLSKPLAGEAGSARVFPIWGAAQVGRFGGWTDNASKSPRLLALATEEGAEWSFDYPISGVPFGIPV
jgi:hypothetical protein